ncbi:MAG: AAA family ATPase, partial [Acutalibacteraceae bacterium]
INAKFTEAKNLALNGKPTILLVDEIDAIGSKRIVGKTDKETVSFMGQLDNLKFSDNVIVIATTNSLSSVDPAVKRPGRLEIQVEMTLPSDNDILKVGRICLEGFKFEGDQDVESFISIVLPYLRGGTPAKTKRICESAIASNMSSKHISAYRDVVLTVNDIVSAAQQYSD